MWNPRQPGQLLRSQSRIAAARLAELERWKKAGVVKAVPDKAQLPVRARALDEGTASQAWRSASPVTAGLVVRAVSAAWHLASPPPMTHRGAVRSSVGHGETHQAADAPLLGD